MADKEWLKHLAGATWKDGRWQLAEPERARDLLRSRLEDAVDQLFLESQDACELFNLYAAANRKITVLPIHQGSRMRGLTLMLGPAQAAVTSDGQSLDFTLTITQGFQRIPVRGAKFLPQVDAFGSLVWHTNGGPLMSYDLLVKTILEELTRLAQSSAKP